MNVPMVEYFRGWKRKLGCVTLVITCALVVGWLRSRTATDYLLWDFKVWNYKACGLMVKSQDDVFAATLGNIERRMVSGVVLVRGIFTSWS